MFGRNGRHDERRLRGNEKIEETRANLIVGHKCYKHIDGVDVKAKFSKDLSFRYRLEITLKNFLPSERTACVVMQNPSYAGEDVADKSVQFMEKVVFQKNLPEFEKVRRLLVVNQFAAIQTNGFQGLSHEIGSENDAAIKTALNESDIIILGWGCANPFKERQAFVIDLLRKEKRKRLFKTRTHPARGAYDGFIQPFTI
jgi:hypothetical protein